MMPMGLVHVLPPGPDGLECWAFYLEAGVSPSPGGAYRIFSLGCNQGIFSLGIL